MSNRKVELLLEGLRRFEAGDENGAAELYHPDIVVWATDDLLNSGEFHGVEAVMKWARTWNDPWDEISYEPLEFIEVSEEILVVRIRIRGRTRGGPEVSLDIAWMLEVENELLKRWELHMNPEAAEASARLWLAGQTRG